MTATRKNARTCFFCKMPGTLRPHQFRRKRIHACQACMPSEGNVSNPRRNKFNARHTYVAGIRFDSKREADHYTTLRALEVNGKITDLERQVKFELHGKRGGLIGRYTVDFCHVEQGRKIATEVKGYRTEAYKLRRKLFLDEYGGEYEHREV